ncbi:hypothetical protein SAMN04488067_10344 [Halorubrum xinjiangense]|uniref:Dolichyl-phosphate-mannose-protein mannosyltransferase n=1 Tax=Halorubrum xinjiangense TaxID=261291 RepID=A0A1G7JPP0_9EURY|nr:glycosyltransferase family 39 protein [Halorubrum xinjiangense]SDF26928.1 hypothetical protein SAMN04488067_10344 [Halorubrum xinjiangense]
MSGEHAFRGLLSLDRPDVAVARLGVVACLLLLGLRLLTSQPLLVIIPVAGGAGCLLYLGARRRRSAAFEYPTIPRSAAGYLPAGVFAGLAGLVVLLRLSGTRTLPIYLLTGAIGAAVLGQALFTPDDELAPGLVVTQIVVAAVVIRFSVLFATPGFIGVDVWTHVPDFVAGIVEAESLSAIAESKYSMAPFYHAIGAAGALVLGSARVGTYLTVGLLVPLSALFVYAAGSLILPVRWALAATALYAFADQFVRWGLHVIPTSLGLVFFLGALYALTALLVTDDLRAGGLLAAFSLATVFTHQVSTAVVLVLLGAAAASVLAIRVFGGPLDGPPAATAVTVVGTFLATLVVTVVSWVNTPWYGDDPFLWQILDTLAATLVGEAGFLNLAGGSGGGAGAAEAAGPLAGVVPYVEWFGFAVLLGAAIVGGLAMARSETPPAVTLSYLASAAAMFVVVFGFSIFGVRTIMPGRWIAFMYAPFAIVAALGLFHLSQHASRRVILVVFVVVALGYPATMVVAEKATLDSPAFDDEYPRFSYTESEIAAVESISAAYPPGEDRADIRSDHPYYTLLERYGGYSGDRIAVDESGADSAQPFVFREYQTTGPATFETTAEPAGTVRSRTFGADHVCSGARNHVYANGDVTLCTAAAAGPGADA